MRQASPSTPICAAVAMPNTGTAAPQHGVDLSHRPDLSYSDLARRARITTQSVHATVRSLEERGAVQRVPAGHGHAARLEITDEGRRLLRAVGDVAARLDRELLADLDDAQRDVLAAALRELVVPSASGRVRPGPV